MQIPLGGASGTIRAAVLTAEPKTSPSLNIISPIWIPARMTAVMMRWCLKRPHWLLGARPP